MLSTMKANGRGRTEQLVEADEVGAAVGRPASLRRRVLQGRLWRRIGRPHAAPTEPLRLLRER